MKKLTGLLLLAMGMAGFASAAAVPEIDPASSIGALTLLSGGLLVLRSRRKK